MVGLHVSILTLGSVGMGIPMGIPVGIPVGMGWVWGLKCHPHGSPAARSHPQMSLRPLMYPYLAVVVQRLQCAPDVPQTSCAIRLNLVH